MEYWTAGWKSILDAYLFTERERSLRSKSISTHQLSIYLSLSFICHKKSSGKIVVAHLDGKIYVLQMH